MSDAIEVKAEQAGSAGRKPSLWNPTAAANLGVVFTPIFGAWIHARNWEALGQPGRAKKSMIWAGISIAVLLLCPFLPDDVGYGPGFVLLVAWYAASARKQITYVKENLANTYEHRSWKSPLLGGVAGLIVVVVLFGWIGAAGTSSTPEKLFEKEALTLVNQIIAEQREVVQASGADLADCVNVEIVRQMDENLYRAKAHLDNGNFLPISISLEGDQIYVTVLNE